MIALPGIAIQSKIDESSNSLVYRGIRDDGVALIVKTLKLDYLSPQELTRYRQEYKITRSFNLEGVVKAYSQQDYQRTLVILLEDFGGESLQWMHKRPDIFCPIPLSTFLGLAIAISDILGRIHAANVIHKDINPGNIVLNLDTGVVKIIDFGIATQFNPTNPTFKSHYVLEGTLGYLSPEQTGRMNRLLDYRTDFYSLGVTFYELLTGHLPFKTTDMLELVHCHIAKQPLSPHEINTIFLDDLQWVDSATLNLVKLIMTDAQTQYLFLIGAYRDNEVNPSHPFTMVLEELKKEGATINNLLGQSENSSHLMGCIYNEEQALSRAIAVKDRTGIHHFYLNKLILCYLFGEYQQAAQTAILAEQYLGKVTALISVPLFHFYDSLVFLSVFANASNSEKEAWLNRVNTNQQKIEKWAHHAPMNYLHKFQLVEAEKARVLGQVLEAEEFYEQAIAGASENKFIQEEALAYELAAKFYLERGRLKIAQTYMKEAHYAYTRWGATAKIEDLETRYPQLFPQQSAKAGTSIRTTSGTTSNCSDVSLDLATVMKASLAISSEIELEQLLRSLMNISIENAGAQTGFLLLENSGEWVIEASCELADGENICATRVLQSISMVNQLPKSIIQYVIRTHESVILNDATREGNFINEPYIQQNQTKSLLCLPLLNQSKLVGVLYLENQLATGAFTPERSQLLNLLSTQAAIAIENAKLYSELRASESSMTQFLEAIPLGVAVVDATGRPYYFNQQATQLIGKGVVSSATIDQLAETYQAYVAGTNQKYPTEKLNLYRALKGERTRTDDLEIHRGNTIIPVEIWGTPVFDEQGKVAYAIATFQDITERKRAEAQLAKSETLLRTIVQSEPECVKLVAADGTLLDMNPAGLAIIEADSLEQVQGRSIYPLVVEEHRAARQALTERVFQGESGVLEFEMVGLKGTHRWLETHTVPLRDENQTVIALLEVTRDITKRKQAEQLLADYNRTLEQQVAQRTAALQQSQAELREREDELRVIADALPVCIIYVDADQHYRFVNRTYEDWFHRSRGEILGKHICDNLGEASYQVAKPYINRALAGEITTYELEMPCVYGKKYVSNSLIPDFDDNGQVKGYYGLITDISEQRSAALRERKRAEEASILEERNRMAREIHDTLAQAFTGILVHMGTVSRLVATNPQAIQTHINIVRELARSGLTEARRSVAALRPQSLEDGNLWTALQRFVANMQSSTETSLICDIISTPYTLPPETENNLLRIAQEAFTNSIRYANANEIRIELIYEPTQFCLRIKDNGQGFEVNHTTLNRGFGLLGITERAERIGAQLSIESRLGQGTETTVSVHREASA